MDPDDFQEAWDVVIPSRGGRKRIQDIKGDTYGRLKPVERRGTDKHGSALWFCECACGGSKVVSRANLRKGRVKSCGCLKGSEPT